MKQKDLWPFIDIYILNFNSREDLRIILQKLQLVDYPKYKYQIIIVDNNSTDGSKEMLARDFPYVQVVPLTKNHGMSALNYGFKNRKGTLCFILDDDSYFEKHAIKEAIEEFRRDPKLGILACNILSFDGVSEFKYLPQEGKVIPWCDFIGGGCVIRSRVFKKIGYFSSDIFLYGHEIHFSLRAMNRGFHIKYAPAIRVFRTALPNKMNAFRMRLGIKNFLYIYWTFLSFSQAIGCSIVMSSEYLLLAIKYGLWVAYIYGLCDLLRAIPKILKARTQVSRDVESFWARLYPFTIVNTFRRLLRVYSIRT